MRISDWSSDVCSSDLQDMQASITEPAALLRQLAQLLPNIGIVTTLRPVAHALPIGPCDTARPPLAHPMASLAMGDRFPLNGGRHHFSVGRTFLAPLCSIWSLFDGWAGKALGRK